MTTSSETNWRERLLDSSRDSAVADQLTYCLELLLRDDIDLLRDDANERSISHRLAVYMDSSFPGWHVDCEYNRDGVDPKRIEVGSGDDREQGSRVLPDIIVHRRRTSENLLVVEIKKSSNRQGSSRDKQKLRSYCQELGYRHGVFVEFAVGDTPDVAEACFIYPRHPR